MIKRNVIKMVFIWLFLVIICALLGDTAIASNNGQATADFLNIGVGSRASGLGGAYTSVADDASSAYWNPGGLTEINTTEFMFSHYSWYQDINYEYFGVAHRLNEKTTVSAGASYLGYGSIEGYDVDDNPTGELDATYNMAVSMSVGYSITEELSAGVTAKYISVSLAGQGASALAADFGVKYRYKKIALGLAFANFGQKMKFNQVEEDLPTNLRAGISLYSFGNSLLSSFEVEKQIHGYIVIKNGYEYCYNKCFIRTGYNYYPSQDNDKLGSGLSFGVGVNLSKMRFDYTFSPEDRFSSESLHRFSVTFSLEK